MAKSSKSNPKRLDFNSSMNLEDVFSGAAFESSDDESNNGSDHAGDTNEDSLSMCSNSSQLSFSESFGSRSQSGSIRRRSKTRQSLSRLSRGKNKKNPMLILHNSLNSTLTETTTASTISQDPASIVAETSRNRPRRSKSTSTDLVPFEAGLSRHGRKKTSSLFEDNPSADSESSHHSSRKKKHNKMERRSSACEASSRTKSLPMDDATMAFHESFCCLGSAFMDFPLETDSDPEIDAQKIRRRSAKSSKDSYQLKRSKCQIKDSNDPDREVKRASSDKDRKTASRVTEKMSRSRRKFRTIDSPPQPTNVKTLNRSNSSIQDYKKSEIHNNHESLPEEPAQKENQKKVRSRDKEKLRTRTKSCDSTPGIEKEKLGVRSKSCDSMPAKLCDTKFERSALFSSLCELQLSSSGEEDSQTLFETHPKKKSKEYTQKSTNKMTEQKKSKSKSPKTTTIDLNDSLNLDEVFAELCHASSDGESVESSESNEQDDDNIENLDNSAELSFSESKKARSKKESSRKKMPSIRRTGSKDSMAKVKKSNLSSPNRSQESSDGESVECSESNEKDDDDSKNMENSGELSFSESKKARSKKESSRKKRPSVRRTSSKDSMVKVKKSENSSTNRSQDAKLEEQTPRRSKKSISRGFARGKHTTRSLHASMQSLQSKDFGGRSMCWYTTPDKCAKNIKTNQKPSSEKRVEDSEKKMNTESGKRSNALGRSIRWERMMDVPSTPVGSGDTQRERHLHIKNLALKARNPRHSLRTPRTPAGKKKISSAEQIQHEDDSTSNDNFHESTFSDNSDDDLQTKCSNPFEVVADTGGNKMTTWNMEKSQRGLRKTEVTQCSA